MTERIWDWQQRITDRIYPSIKKHIGRVIISVQNGKLRSKPTRCERTAVLYISSLSECLRLPRGWVLLIILRFLTFTFITRILHKLEWSGGNSFAIVISQLGGGYKTQFPISKFGSAAYGTTKTTIRKRAQKKILRQLLHLCCAWKLAGSLWSYQRWIDMSKVEGKWMDEWTNDRFIWPWRITWQQLQIVTQPKKFTFTAYI